MNRAQLDAGDVDDLILAETLYGGGVIGRHVAVTTGLISAPGLALNRHRASGLTAVEAGITRRDMDEWAWESHRKAVAAIVRGWANVGVDPERTGMGPADAVPGAASATRSPPAARPDHGSCLAGRHAGLSDHVVSIP